MFKIVSLWNLAKGVTEEEAEKQYFEDHIPMAKAIPGLRKYTVAKARGKERLYYRMAELYFDDKDSMNVGMSSSQGQATIEDKGFRSKITDRTVMYFDEEQIV